MGPGKSGSSDSPDGRPARVVFLICSWSNIWGRNLVFEEPTLAEAVGLKHVIEDGLAVLEGRALDASRRDFVMRDLRSLLN